MTPANRPGASPLARPAALLIALSAAHTALAQPPVIQQTLVAGSTYTRDGCLDPCDCLTLDPPPRGPLTGTFTLRFESANPLYTFYTVTDVDVTATLPGLSITRYLGAGTYQIGGEVALTHRLILDLQAVNEPAAPPQHFDSGMVIVSGNPAYAFPAIDITASTGNVFCYNRTIVVRTTNSTPCTADLGGPGGLAGPDGELDNNDFIALIDAFFNADPAADLGSPGGLPGPDGRFDNNDFVAFIDLFFSGC